MTLEWWRTASRLSLTWRLSIDHERSRSRLMGASELRTLRAMLAARGSSRSEAPAILAPGRTPLSHAGLQRQLHEVQSALVGAGMGRADRIALLLPPGPELAVALTAVASLATSMPLDPALRPGEYEGLLDQLGPSALMTLAGLDSPVRAIARSRGLPVIELFPRPDGAAGTCAVRGGATDERPSGPTDGLRGKPRAVDAGPDGQSPCDDLRDPPGPDDVALVLPTSGTTGRPKLVPLTHENLCASMRNIGVALALDARDRCLDVMPLYHVHGLAVLWAALVAGGSVVCPPAFDVRRFFAWLEETRPTWYTAVPTMHHAILAEVASHRAVVDARPLRFIRSASAPLPTRLGAELEAAFGVPVIEAYGMTEAAHQIASNPLPPEVRKPGSVGRPVGTEVAILDSAGHPVPSGIVGEVAIRGANVTVGRPEGRDPETRSRTAPRDDGQVPTTDGSGAGNDGTVRAVPPERDWLRTGDEGWLDAEGYLFLTGRLTDVINRGGEKISPREVDEVLLAHPGVSQAVAFPVPHRTLGEDLAAAIVPRTGAVVTERAIRDFVADRLAAFKVPGQLFITDVIPGGPTGKPRRRALAAALGDVLRGRDGLPEEHPGESTRSAVEARLTEIWREVLAIEGVGIHENFFALGGDSIRAALVLARVRDRLGAELPLRAIFETPTLAELAATIEGTGRSELAVERPPIASTPGHTRRPLSPAERGIWLLDRLLPGHPAYNRPEAFRIRGPLDPTALVRAFQTVTRRHAILRTTFGASAGEPLAIVAPASDTTLSVVDLREVPRAEREAEAMRLAEAEVRRPFDLARGPLARAVLLRLDPDEHLLVLTVHHMVTDGWSSGIIHRELSVAYGAWAAGHAPELPALPIEYGDFAAWHREWFRGPILERQLAYWTRQLATAPAELALPYDRPRPPHATLDGGTERLILPPALREALTALSRQEGVTLFMTMLAAFKALLARYTGQTDLVVGVPVAGRTHVATEGVVGLFVNTLPLRTELGDDPPFLELLARVREVALAAEAHQDLPFARLVEALNPERAPGRMPVVQSLFVFENGPTSALTLDDLDVASVPLATGTAKVDLTLAIEDTPRGPEVSAEYSTELFDAATITRLLGHYRVLLDGIARDPSRRVSELPLLTEPERRQLVVDWNETERPYPQDAGIHELVEAQVRRTPEAVAIAFEGRRLSYRTLDGSAKRVARCLGRRGIRAGEIVGICLERSPELPVAMLGVLKAGGAYLPLDPAYPPERLGFMLEDAGVRVVLTREPLLNLLGRHRDTAICLDRDRQLLEDEPDTSPAARARSDPDRPAYVAYTSGSTGVPKGVMASHRGAVNHLAFCMKTYGVGSSDVVLQLASASFDASVREFFAPLGTGACVVLVPQAVVADPVLLLGAIRRHRVTAILAIVPTLLRALMAAADAHREALATVRVVLVSGEPLLGVDTARAQALLPAGAQLVNQYGPTECTMISSYHRVAPADHPCHIVAIGRPIDNTRFYILDSARNPVPIGVQGELYIGGVGVARGYLNRPDLTAERFIADPFVEGPSAMLYRTGDFVRYRSDGIVEFLGRLDEQVKIRGVRIELAEVDTALRQHAGLREAATVAREDEDGERRLVAYVVPNEARPPTVDDLRVFLAKKLPPHMIPGHFVCLDRLPLGPSRKLDRRALPAPNGTRPELNVAFVAPRTPVEEELARTWAELLGVQTVGIHDSFFSLGGHSLLAARLLARVDRAFHVTLSLRAFFSAPTVAELALLILEHLARRAGHAGMAEALNEISDRGAEALPPRGDSPARDSGPEPTSARPAPNEGRTP